jgi:hypothetical protein
MTTEAPCTPTALGSVPRVPSGIHPAMRCSGRAAPTSGARTCWRPPGMTTEEDGRDN